MGCLLRYARAKDFVKVLGMGCLNDNCDSRVKHVLNDVLFQMDEEEILRVTRWLQARTTISSVHTEICAAPICIPHRGTAHQCSVRYAAETRMHRSPPTLTIPLNRRWEMLALALMGATVQIALCFPIRGNVLTRNAFLEGGGGELIE